MKNLRKSKSFNTRWPGFSLTPDRSMKKKWVVYEWREDDIARYGRIDVEDLCILTEDGEEVIGCSDSIRCDREVFEYIVKIHNERVEDER